MNPADKRTMRGGYVKRFRSPQGGVGGLSTPDRGRRVAGRGGHPILCEWERRLSAEGMPDPDRVVIQTLDGPRLRLRRFWEERGAGGRAAVKSGPGASGRGLAIGRARAAEVRAERARVDLRLRRFRRRRARAGRVPKVLRPGMRRAILDMHAQGYGYRAICRALRLGVSYGTVRRVMLEILEAIRSGERGATVRELVEACDPGFLQILRRAGMKVGERSMTAPRAERLVREPVIADLLREDREGTWARMLDGHRES